jgi:uncharacterized protein YunC (DUF1805 family)
MQPIIKLEGLHYITIKLEIEKKLEQLQNHHIATVMDGSKNLGDYMESQACELVYRAMKVGITNGINRPNLQYMLNKLQSALEYLEELEGK